MALANITFVETQVRAGRGPFPVKLPMIMGNGVGGTVQGRRVIASLGGSGGYAERVAVPAASLIEVPDALALDDAVALLADGRTATMLAEAAASQAGERVLILAAAGGVGTLLVQLARGGGGVGGGRGRQRRQAGGGGVARRRGRALRRARRPVRRGLRRRRRRGRALGVRAARRAAGGCSRIGLASGTWAGISAEEAAARGVTLVQPDRDPAALRGYTERALAAGLRPVIGQRFPLERAADAHAAIEARATTGKTLLDVR